MTDHPSRIAALDEWIRGKEGENLEFKSARSNFHFEELTKYCVALANEGGGKIILGVTDERPRQIVGSKAFLQPERTRKGLCERIPLGIDFEEIDHPDCAANSRVLVFSVPSRPVGVAIQHDGHRWVRKEDSLVEMSDDRLRRIYAETGHDFSADVCADATPDDLDDLAIENFRDRWIAKANKAEDQELVARIQAMSGTQLLEDIEAVVNGRVTYAALILFGTNRALTRHLAAAEIVFEYRSNDNSGPAQDRKEFRQAFFTCYDNLWNVINLRNDKQDFQEGLFVVPISTFNERPVREAILNAVSHRDYQLGGSIFIRQYPRRLEIDSPGGFPVGITLENILDRQNPRNRRVAEILTRCGLVERSGQGMNLIYEDLIKQSKPAPEFSRTDQYQVGLTLHGTVQDPAFVRFVEKVSKETTAFFHTHDWMLMSEASRGEKLPKESEPRIKRLIDLGIIERGKGRKFMLSRKYYEFVGKAADYTRRKGLDHDHNLALLKKHLDESGEAGASLDELAQVLPSLPKEEVRNLLRILKYRGIAGTKGRGPGSRWIALEGDGNES
ncbi:ATP-binding protein [Rhodopirellula bahusiensis]|uniref:Transcriptional regulator n=1 Tax=Rhodopirellula bahusiensis TaxID=2014065 RepID=A0A2G1W3A6_9BACT|nr:ATP-binding protein [Rhodopirellula bahusiensis]PHQ33149.1 transcriptional regulator [Rhodopirellula bahusiensis]